MALHHLNLCAASGLGRSLFALGLLASAACASTPDPSAPWIDFASLQPRLPTNRALACDPAVCLATSAFTPEARLKAAPDVVLAALLDLEPGAEHRTEANGDLRSRYVAVTPLVRFRDDVDVLIRPGADGTTTVAVYSRSRVGLSDLGKNAARVNDLTERLSAAVSPDDAVPPR